MKKLITFLLCTNIISMPLYAYIIEDEFVNNTLDKNLKIQKHKTVQIEDEFASLNKNKNIPKRDVEIKEITPSNAKKFVRKPIIIDDNTIGIKVRIKEDYTTKNRKLQEGDILEFVTCEDAKIKDTLYPKNSIVKARLETISPNYTWGVPADVIISNFTLGKDKLSGEISKTGANRILWLRPLVGATSWFFGIGLLLIPIRGGHAKIKQSQVYTLYATE